MRHCDSKHHCIIPTGGEDQSVSVMSTSNELRQSCYSASVNQRDDVIVDVAFWLCSLCSLTIYKRI